MTSTFFFLALWATMTLASRWECPEGYCEAVKCRHITTENCAGKIVVNGSTCGCCDGCVRVLKPGQNCIEILLLEDFPTETCPDSYICDTKTVTCQPLLT